MALFRLKAIFRHFFLVLNTLPILFATFSICFQPVSAQVPPTPQATIAEEQDYAFAYGLYKDGSFQLAVEQFTKFLEKYPNSLKRPDVFFLRTECLYQQEQYESAAKAFIEFVKQYPTSNLADNAYFRLGDTYLKLKKNQEAIAAYKGVLDRYAESDLAGEAAYWIGETYVKDEEYDTAIKYYTLAYENYPTNRLRDYALYSVAWAYQRKGDYAKAAEAYWVVIKEFPQNNLAALAKVRIGECYYYLKEYRRAIDELTAAKPTIEGAEQRGEADYLIAESYYNLNEYDQARAQYEGFLVSYTDHKLTRDVLYALGWTLLKQKEFSKAAATFGRLVDGRDALAHAALFRRGVAEKLAGNRDGAAQTFMEIFSRQPQGEYADNALYEIGLMYFEDKKTAEAKKYFDRVVAEADAGDVLPDAHQMIGECLVLDGNFDEAKDAFEKAVAMQSAPFEVKVASSYQIGWCLYKSKKLKESATQFSKFIDGYPQHPRAAEALYWLAESEYQSENYRSALKHYQAIADNKSHPRNEEGMYGVGWSHVKLKEYPKAILAFERFIVAHPNSKFSFDARLRLGDSYFFQKDYKKAAGVYRTVVRLFARHDGVDYAYYQLAQTSFRANDYDEASSQFSSLITTFPKSDLADDAQYALGWIHFQGKQYQGAIKEYEELLAKYPESDLIPRAHYSIGDAYYNMQQYAPAEKSYREVLRRYPKSTYVLDALTGIQYCLVAQGKQGEAVAVMDSYVKENPGSPIAEQLSLKKGDLLFGQKQYDAAAASYRSFAERYPQSNQRGTVLYWLGRSLAALNRLSEAAAVYEQAASAKNASEKIVANALIEAVNLYLQQKNYEKAFATVGKAEKQLANSEWVMEVAYLKGLVFFENGALDEAKSQFDYVISKYKATSQADKARVGLARVHLHNKDYSTAQTLAQRVATSRTDEVGAEAQYLIGVTYFEMQDWKNAETAFLRMRYVFPKEEQWLAKSYLHLGQVYEETKNLPKAREAYQNVLKLQKEGEAFAEASRRLKNL